MDITKTLLTMAPEIRTKYGRKLRCMRHRADIDDLTQAIYVKAWKHRRSCKGTTQAAVRRWLRVVAANVFRSTVNKHLGCANRSLRRESCKPIERVIECDPSNSLEAAEAKQTAREVIKQLPSRHQLAVKLRFIEEREYNQVALAMGISEHRARTLAATGVRRLKQMA